MASTFVLNSSKTRNDSAIGGLRRTVVGVLTTDGSDGAAANDILATLFGLRIIESCSPLVKSDNSIIVVVGPSYDGLSLLGKAAATAAAADIPSGDYAVEVKGT